MSAEEIALLYQILQLILSSASDLVTLDMSETGAALTLEIVSAINSHSHLRKVIPEDLQQLYSPPLAFLYSTSLSRFHFRTGDLTDEPYTPHTHTTLQNILSRESDGPHIYELTLWESYSPAWTSFTIKGLRTLHVIWSDSDLAPSCGAFFDRHPLLSDIHLSGTGLRDIHAIERVPLLSSLYEAARRQGLLDTFWMNRVHVLNGYLDQSEPEPHLRKVSIRISKRLAEVVGFLLETLPVFEELHLACDADIREQRNFVSVVRQPRPSLHNTLRLIHTVFL